MLTRLRRAWTALTSDVVDAAGEEYGEFEDATGNPWYHITPYSAVVVPDRLMRGSWPSPAELDLLSRQGIRTVVNLCSERKQDAEVIAAGLTPVNLPVRDNTVPTPDEISLFLSTVAASPTYVHCEQGKGRTGVFCAAFRVLVQKFPVDQALDEAVQYGLRMPAQKEFILSLRSGNTT